MALKVLLEGSSGVAQIHIRFKKQCSEQFYRDQVLPNSAWILIIRKTAVSYRRARKCAWPESQIIKDLSTEKIKLIGLGDLIPKQGVTGGHQLRFGTH